MTFHVYPDPQDNPLSLAAGATHPQVQIEELFGNSVMVIRYILVGSGCAPPASPASAVTVFLTADTEEVEITSVDNVQPTELAGGLVNATVIRPGAGGRGVFQLQVSKFTAKPINWKIRFRNNDTTPHQLTWVVAESDADSRQPWIELPHRADWQPILGDIPAGQVVPLTVQVANKGTGDLEITNRAGPLGATGFELAALPAKIAPNGCGNLSFRFTVPAGSGTSTASFTADSNDSKVPLDPTRVSHNGQLKLVAEVGVPEPEFNPSPNQFSPREGAPGVTVTLFGRHFDIGDPVVKFGDVAAASVGDPTSTGVTAVVPVGLPDAVQIKVITDGGTAESTDLFTVQGLRPQITGFTPSQGRSADPDNSIPGAAVTITGDHFVEGETSVTFKDEPAVVDDITSTRIVTTVPVIPSGNYFITVETRRGGSNRSTVPFVVLPKPTFNAPPNQFRPLEGPPGTAVILRGRNFSIGVPQVKFGDLAAALVGDPTPTGVTAVVPSGLPLGGVPITISTDGGRAVSDDVFTVRGLPPQLDGCTPTQGRSQDQKTSTPGTIVTITGNHFEVGTTVKFGDVPAVVDSITDTRILTKVPILDAGTYAISVATQWGPAPSTVPFIVLAKPAFNASPNQFSPPEGAAGTTVTLRGQNFNVGTPRVMFGQVAAASIGAPSATGLTAVVPGGLSLGGVPITVVTDGGTALSSDVFTVRGLPPQIDRFTPPKGRPENPKTQTRGTIIKVIGSHFEVGATTVTFKQTQKETPGAVINMTDSRIRVKVPTVDAGNYVINVATQWGPTNSKASFVAVQGNPTYVVQRGDTLSEIAVNKFGVSLQALLALNPQIKDRNRIEVGQVINVPLTYVVERGDTMGDIAVTFGVSLDALKAANPQIKNINRIEIGQVIIIP